ncbi:hypothetical protein [Nocardia sp. SSK8]|uniref:hypothetical protein n=1 Tax=Nocardia sp. SSK8 TaxID=3120154 RepID=UPI00300A8E3F
MTARANYSLPIVGPRAVRIDGTSATWGQAVASCGPLATVAERFAVWAGAATASAEGAR